MAKIRNDEKSKSINDLMKSLGQMNPEAKSNAIDTLRFLVNQNKKTKDEWRLEACVPKYGPIIPILNAFKDGTDIPLEIPFFCIFHLISGHLLNNGVKLKGAS